MLGYRRAADRNILAQKIPPTSVLIHWTDLEKPAALIQCLGENPGVQNRSTYTLFPVLCGLSKCVPFDTNALLWKVKNKYDQNPTILCTFVHRGCFIVLKKKKFKLHGFGSVLFYKPLSKLANVIYFSHPKMCTNGSQIHTAQPQTVGDIVPGMELAWMPCDCWSSRSPGTEMLICV